MKKLADSFSYNAAFRSHAYNFQLTLINEKLGKLPGEHLDFVTSDKAKRFLRKQPDTPPAPFSPRHFREPRALPWTFFARCCRSIRESASLWITRHSPIRFFRNFTVHKTNL